MEPRILLCVFMAMICVTAVSAQDLSPKEETIPISHMLIDGMNSTYNESFYDSINASAWSQWAYEDANRFEFDYALKGYDLAIKKDPNFIEAWNNKGAILRLMNRYDEALKCYERAEKIDPSNDIVWNNKGEVLFKMGRLDEALDSFNKSLNINPKSSFALSNKGTVFIAKGRYDDALKCYEGSTELFAENYATWCNKGVALAKLKNYEEALRYFRESAILNENNTASWVNGALVLREMGQDAKADEALATARMLGFNGSVDDYVLESVPKFMRKSRKSMPGCGVPLAIASLSFTGFAIFRRMFGKRSACIYGRG